MISIRNLEKYFNDHPEIKNGQEIIEAAKVVATKNLLPAGLVDELLGSLAEKFWLEVQEDPDHIQIGMEDIQASHKKRSG